MELSEEEKKAIELLKKLQKKTPYIIWGDGTPYNKNNQIQTILNLIKKQQKEIEREKQYTDFYKDLCNKQQKEIEEKTTIIMAGAEKVKQLEKEIQRLEKDNDTLSELVIVNEDKVIKELDLISKDKIRELKEKVEKEMISNPYDFSYMINELLEEN